MSETGSRPDNRKTSGFRRDECRAFKPETLIEGPRFPHRDESVGSMIRRPTLRQCRMATP